MSLPAGVFVVTPVIVLFRGFLGAVGLTWGDLGVWGCLVITGRDPNCSYVVDLLKRLLFNIHSPLGMEQFTSLKFG